MKRGAAFILITAIVFLCVGVSTVAQDTDGILTAGNVTPNPGDTFSISLYLDANTSLNAFRLLVTYDQSILTFVDVEDGAILSGIGTMVREVDGEPLTNEVALVWNEADPVEENGLLCKLKFTLSESLQPGAQTTVAVAGDPEEGWCLDGDLELYEFVPVSVKVMVAYPCDITFDGEGITTDIALNTPVSDVVSELESGGYTDVVIRDKDGTDKLWSALVGTGDTILASGNVFTVCIPGDLNNDGTESVTDYVILRSQLLNPGILSGVYEKAADLNNDGSVSVTDYVTMRAHLLAR